MNTGSDPMIRPCNHPDSRNGVEPSGPTIPYPATREDVPLGGGLARYGQLVGSSPPTEMLRPT